MMRVCCTALVLILVAILMFGCQSLPIEETAASLIDTKRTSNDLKLEGGELLYCDSPSAGSLVRRYGSDSEVWRSYWEHCNTLRNSNLIPPPPAP